VNTHGDVAQAKLFDERACVVNVPRQSVRVILRFVAQTAADVVRRDTAMTARKMPDQPAPQKTPGRVAVQEQQRSMVYGRWSMVAGLTFSSIKHRTSNIHVVHPLAANVQPVRLERVFVAPVHQLTPMFRHTRPLPMPSSATLWPACTTPSSRPRLRLSGKLTEPIFPRVSTVG